MVIAMIAVLMASMTTSVSAARKRARIQKATNDVKVISQAILAYENYNQSGSDYKLPTLNKAEAGRDTLGFLMGDGTVANGGGQIPVLLQAALTSGGKILDPWGHPYLVTIKQSNLSLSLKTVTGNLRTGYYLPNFYRLSETER